MEDRYELRGKIGQGGIGSVHRAYDTKMRREVAIKRILTSSEDPHLQAEATKQLLTEVSALASLQHPHIVTVYDVGSDEEGPYIVMELINGKTLDEIAENAPLVWHDFKIVAMQTLEALIAAQELNLIHSDLKPPNIMLTWLPSGAFQVKIVDFGLAVLIQNQSQEEIEKLEAVYGSIFFMPPEQYERKTLDTRSDLYSLGCCFYQALAGIYPFSGSTGMEVMEAHLNHTVRPIQEIRSDIPLWACNWVMWLINRYPDDRPPSAREALANFLQNDKETNPIMSRGGASGKHPRFIIPDPSTGTATGPVPTAQLTSSVRTSAVLTASHMLGVAGENPTATGPVDPALVKRKRIKTLLKATTVTIAVCLFGALIWFLIKRNEARNFLNAYTSIVSTAARNDVKQVHINGAQLKIVLEYIAQSKPGEDLTYAHAALAKAKASDVTNFDAVISDFATSANLPAGTRIKLFDEVIQKRMNPASIPSMIKYSARAKNADEAAAAYSAVRRMVREEHAEGLIDIIASTEHLKVRQAAESEMTSIIARSQNPNALKELISNAIKNTKNPEALETLNRLLALCKPPASAQAPPKPPAQPMPPVQPALKPYPKPVEGDVIRAEGVPALFLIKGGKRCGFKSQEVFKAGGFSRDKIIDVSEADLKAIPVGEAITAAP